MIIVTLQILHLGEMPISTETHLLIGADILFSITDFVGNTVLVCLNLSKQHHA
jgi:hypothetical protein